MERAVVFKGEIGKSFFFIPWLHCKKTFFVRRTIIGGAICRSTTWNAERENDRGGAIESRFVTSLYLSSSERNGHDKTQHDLIMDRMCN
jgi:hypothetical protein